MAENWISAAQAYQRLEAANVLGCGYAICARAYDGVVATRAKVLVIGSKREVDVEVPPAFWWARGESALEQNWKTGDFSTWIDSAVHCRAYGVTFREGDIDAMLPEPAAAKFGIARALLGNYAPAAKCLQELEASTHLPLAAIQAEILRHCRAGLVAARCDKMHIETHNRYGTESDDRDSCVVADWFWRMCDADPDAVMNWDSGRFSGAGPVDGDFTRCRISGLEFEVKDIIDIEAMLLSHQKTSQPMVSDESDTDASPQTKRGRKPSYDWDAAVTAIWGKIYRGDLVPDSQAAIELAFIALLKVGDKEPSESTVRPYASRIWNEMQKA